jgi:glycosyltransferase involved in cell wall biosynthesis
MKIGMLVHNPPYQGGIVQYSVLLVNSMKDVDFNLVGFKSLYPPFFYKGQLPKIDRSGIHFFKESKNFVTWYNPLSWARAYFQLSKSDIIHLHWVSPLLAPLQFFILRLNRVFYRRKVVLTCHNIEPHESTIFDKIFTKLVFSKVDHFVVHAEQNRKRLINNYHISSENVHTVPHGTFGYFTQWKKETNSELREEFLYSPKDKIILFFGYIREYKGLRYLIRALPGILKEVPDAKLIVAGELWQDLKIYEEEIRRAGVEKYIRVYSKYVVDQDVHKFFDLADICVLPYHNTEQTISGPLLVSIAFNKPIVVSNVGGISEFLENGQNALIVNGGDVKELEDNVIRLLKDKKLQKKLVIGARKLDSTFDWKNVGDKTIEIYKEILK